MVDGCWKGRGDPAPFVAGLPAHVPRFRSLAALDAAMRCCTRCELAPGRTQVVCGTGPKRARVVFLGEAPGAREDESGKPFVGAAGRLFDRLLTGARLERGDVYITNVVACRPPRNRTPKMSEVKAHRPWLEAQLRLVRPAVIVTLGRVALTWFLPGAKVTELTGRPQHVQWDGRSLVLLPLFHPAAALRSPDRVPLLEEGFRELRRLLRP
jgi:uracil-DNA glycosylase